jgi:hypothetical protein
MERINVVQDGEKEAGCCEYGNETSGFIKYGSSSINCSYQEGLCSMDLVSWRYDMTR